MHAADRPQPRETGVLNARGEPILRAPNPVGFATPKPTPKEPKP